MSEAARVAVEPVAPPAPEAPPWSAARRIGFRLLVAYFALYHCALVDNSDFDYRVLTLRPLWTRLVPWLGHHVLRIGGDIATEQTGSGDRLYDWLLVATFAVLAIVATIVWSVVDRRRQRYDRLAALFRVFIRYHLALQMLSYGFSKLFRLQFSTPGPAQLLRSYGASSPMGILWTFMGASAAYTIFAGGAEVLGGLLVLFRRTTTLGGIVILGVMTNVAMLNYCYDVPVKLFSTHLVVMALILIAPDARRLVDVLVFHRPTAPAAWAWTPASVRARWARRIVKGLLVVAALGYYVRENLKQQAEYGDHAPKPTYYGIYDVESPADYQTAFLDRRWGAVREGERFVINFDLPPKDGKVVQARLLSKDPKAAPKLGQLGFSTPDADHVVLDGTLGDKQLVIRLARRTRPPLLLSRGFHLINEFPFNR